MADQTLARHVNERRILTALRIHGEASRAELARRLSLTPATITRLVANLEGQDLVRDLVEEQQDQAVREPGRPGVRVALNPDGAFFVGVEIGVGVIRIAWIDASVGVVGSVERRVSTDITLEPAVELIADQCALLQANPRFRGKVRCVAVTVPGLVDAEGFVVHLPILSWRNVNLLETLSAAVSLECFVENNANAAAFGAVYIQPALKGDHVIFLKVGTGCGGASIINGRLLRGSHGTAGEFGHLRVTEHGHRCSCGQIGCLESQVNLDALQRALCASGGLDSEELAALPAAVVDAAEAGDARAIEAIDSVLHHLSLGVVSLVNIFNPATVMLGGLMRPVLDYGLDEMRRRIAEGIVSGIARPDLRLSELGVLECAVGAAAIAHHRSFDISNFVYTNQG